MLQCGNIRLPVYGKINLLVLSVVVFVFSACDDTLNPIIESDQQATLWGTLDMNSDVQRLRVVPIRPVIDARLMEKVDLDLRSIDLTTGETVTWSGREVTFSDGKAGVLFEINLKIEPEHTYRIELRSSSFPLVTSAETTIPEVPIATVHEENVRASTGPTGTVVRASQSVVWTLLNGEPHEIEQWYRFLEFTEIGFVDFRLPYDVPNFYDDALKRLELALDLKRQHDTLDTNLSLDQLLLVGLGQTITLLDNKFVPPGGVFDLEILAQPGTFSNVENGFGFVGAVGRFSVEWVISEKSARILNYNPLNGGFRIGNPIGPVTRLAEVALSPWPAVQAADY